METMLFLRLLLKNYFQIKGTNRLEFGSEPDFGWSASGTKLYLVSGTSVPSTTPILGIQQNGNVGIGTNAPVAKLEVSGAIALSSGSIPVAPGYTSLMSLCFTDDDWN